MMKAKVDGTLVNCDSNVYIIQSLTANPDLYGIEGSGKGVIGFRLSFPIGSGVGSYKFKTLNLFGTENYAFFYYLDYQNQFVATSGSVIVTEAYGNHFKGTFTFSATYAYDTSIKRNITEGEFDVYK